MTSSRYSLMSEAYLKMYEGKKGLWDNIHAKRKRGEKPAKPGDKDYPETLNVEETEQVDEASLKQARKNVGADTCWDGYKAKGTKMKGGKSVPNCVKEDYIEYLLDNSFAHNLQSAETIFNHMSDQWKDIVTEELSVKKQMEISKNYNRMSPAQKKAANAKAMSGYKKTEPKKDTRTDAQKMTDATGPRPGSNYRGD